MSNGSALLPSGDVAVASDDQVEIIQDILAGDVDVESEDPLTTIVTGDQGPPGVRGNSVLYGLGPPVNNYGVNGDFYIDLNTALMYGPKAGGAWPPGFSLIGPIGPVGPVGPPGPVGAPGNTIRNGSGAPDPSLGVAGDFYIDTTNHNIYGPKSNTVSGWGSPTSLFGPPGPPGPSGPPPWSTPPVPWATATAYTVGPPASLVTNTGASYVPTVGHISGVDFATDLAAGLWTLVAAAGSPGTLSAQVYVGDTPPTGIPNNTLWWNTTDGNLYLYYFDGDSHQWVIAAPVPDLAGYLQLAGGTMTGPITLPADPTTALQATTKQYVDAHITGGAVPEAPNDGVTYGRKSLAWTSVLPITGGTLTGLLTLSGAPTSALHAATKAYADTKIGEAPLDGFDYARANGAWDKVVPLAGGTMTGLLTLSADPSTALQAATKQYADTKAPVASPAFTGNPTAPTQAVDDNDTSIATTAFVIGQASASGDGTPAMNGTAARGTAIHWARADHVHPSDTTRLTDAAGSIASDGNSYVRKNGAWAIGAGGGAVNSKIQRFTFSGTYTPTSGMMWCVIECQAPGGGAGGVGSSASSSFASGGGAAGGYAKVIKTAAQIGASQAVTIGTGGAGGSGNNPGAAGSGPTSVGTLCSASAGSGGSQASAATVGLGGLGGSGTTGDVLVTGQNGGSGTGFAGSTSGNIFSGGQGGSTIFGSGGRGRLCGAGNSQAGENAAANSGGGGGGGSINASTATTSGGSGADGCVVITEYGNF